MRGYTVEMSFIMPILLLIIMSSIIGVFYFHDKNIISGAAYETAFAGSTKAREKGRITEGELEALFEERVGDKCILFADAEVSVSVDNKSIKVEGIGRKKGMTVSVIKSAPVTDPERTIRDIRRMKGLGNGTQDDN